MTTINKNEIAQIINRTASIIFRKGVTTRESLIIASMYVMSHEQFGKGPMALVESMQTVLANMNIHAGEELSSEVREDWMDVIMSCDLIVDNNNSVSEYWVRMTAEKDLSYPRVASMGITERRKGPLSNVALVADAIQVLEATEYKVDVYMMKLAQSVYKAEALTNKEEYVLEGCEELVKFENQNVVSEFFPDRRGRLYQGDCHGPNGQSSDMARAMMDLADVPMDYDVKLVIKALRDEMSDMVKGDVDEVIAMARGYKSITQFMVECLSGDVKCVKKPWSFVKAARIYGALQAGKKPYIGMAFGLDAKCSGPQLGALLVGDKDLAEACGFTTEDNVKDAYVRAIEAFGVMGEGITRDMIKTPYMGIFYGQGAMAFANPADYDAEDDNKMDPALFEFIKTLPYDLKEFHAQIAVDKELDPVEVAQAFEFHSIIEGSFGKLAELRKRIRAAHYTNDKDAGQVFHTFERTSHYMPDGLKVAMQYNKKDDIFGNRVQHGKLPCDVSIQVGENDTMKFKQLAFQTEEYSEYDYARTGFVNLIQATDALLARLIVTSLEFYGAKHVIAVHDCFRVNVCDLTSGILHKAIKRAYKILMGYSSTKYFRKGNDIIKGYFEGVRKAGSNTPVFTMYVNKATVVEETTDIRLAARLATKTEKVLHIEAVVPNLLDLIGDMENTLDNTGKTYYFAK